MFEFLFFLLVFIVVCKFKMVFKWLCLVIINLVFGCVFKLCIVNLIILLESFCFICLVNIVLLVLFNNVNWLFCCVIIINLVLILKLGILNLNILMFLLFYVYEIVLKLGWVSLFGEFGLKFWYVWLFISGNSLGLIIVFRFSLLIVLLIIECDFNSFILVIVVEVFLNMLFMLLKLGIVVLLFFICIMVVVW